MNIIIELEYTQRTNSDHSRKEKHKNVSPAHSSDNQIAIYQTLYGESVDQSAYEQLSDTEYKI